MGRSQTVQVSGAVGSEGHAILTALLSSGVESIGPGGNVEFQDEFEADGDLRIIACSFHAIHSQEGNTYCTLQRSSGPRMLHRYHEGYEALSTDEILAGVRLTLDGDPNPSTASIADRFFNFGPDYFELADEEKVYFTGRLQNDDNNTHSMLGQCLIYYYNLD